MTDLARLVDFACHLAQLAGDEILRYFRSDFGVDNKLAAGYDPVTIADREAERLIREEILRVYPDHGLLGEEHGLKSGSSPYTWVIDPIDGTRAFVLGQLHWGTLIALTENGRPIIGVMRQPFTGETFVGSPLGGQLRHGGRTQPLRVRASRGLVSATLCATDPTMFAQPELGFAFGRVAARARSVRFGGDCYTPCLVAAGHAHLVVEASLKPWDVQPLIPIVESAGGIITDWQGKRADTADKVVIASDPMLHAEVLEALNASGQ